MEHIAHEIEHIVGLLDGVDLPAQVGSGLVWKSGDDTFEARRAIEIVTRVAREITSRRTVNDVRDSAAATGAVRLTTIVQQDRAAVPSSVRSARMSGSGGHVVFTSSARLVESDRNQFEDACPRRVAAVSRLLQVMRRDLPHEIIAQSPPEHEVVAATGEARILDFTSSRARFWLPQAIQGAAGRLRSRECRRVLSDFKDTSGHLLETNLVRVTADPAEYLLKFVRFTDGSDHTRCKGRVFAFTQPGSRVIFICRRLPGWPVSTGDRADVA